MQSTTQHPTHRGIDRRRWLHHCATTALAGSFILQQFPDLLAGPTSRGFKIGAPDWSLGRRDVSCFQLAAQIGLDGVQLDLGTRENGMHLRRREIQESYLKASRENCVAIGGLALGELNRSALKSEPHTAIWLHDSIATAVDLGVKIILIAQFGNGDLRGDKTGVDRTIGVLKELAPRAEKAGVILGLENYLSAPENLAILDKVGSPAIQVYYDVGNSTDMGHDILAEIRMLRGRLCELHAKDGPHRLGSGRVNFAAVRKAVDEIDYRGWIQIEAAAPGGVAVDYPQYAKFLRTHFPSIT